MVIVFKDIIGRNRKGEKCHPYQHRGGEKAGKYAYTLRGHKTFEYADEGLLKQLIESGNFNDGGLIRMIPCHSSTTAGSSALSVISYKGLPLS